MNVLVTGGAGYVGSHAVKLLRDSGHAPIIYDNLSRGHREVAEILGVPLVVGDLADGKALDAAFKAHPVDVVMHFAAFASVGESVAEPLLYYRNNVAMTVELLSAMARAGVDKLVFSSSCSIYGEVRKSPVREDNPKRPVSPYGRSKLMVEEILADHAHARPTFAFATLRYFNAAGAAADGTIGEDHDPEPHLIPAVLQTALGLREYFTINGTDYPTPDGTVIRDYVHVDDLAEAHVAAMTRLAAGTPIRCNLGLGRGFSVREIADACQRVVGRPVPIRNGARREGDPSAVFADASLAKSLLGWEPRMTNLEEIIRSAWKWHSAHPRGFATAAR